MNETNQRSSQQKWLIGGAAGAALLFLCVCMAAAGFAVGQFSVTERQSEGVEVITESAVLEVTRVVTVEVTAPAPTAVPEEAAEDGMVGEETAVSSPDDPTPVPTDTPTSRQTNDSDEVQIRDADFSVLYEAWGILEEDFDGELPPNEEIVESMIEASVEALDDDYTRYIEPEVAARLREDMGGSVEGIGAFVRENDEGLFEIVRPIDGQPADLAGLMPGDIIIEVDGESVLDLSFDEVLLMVRGPRDTSVRLTVIRDGEAEPLQFTIVRTRFVIPIIEAEMLEDDIAYVRLSEFNRNAVVNLTTALEELFAQDPQALIFDLRDNPGGYLDQSIAVADLFLPAGTVLFERNNQGLDETFRSDDGDLAESIPLVVLVNAGSASASEIVAGAIQDNGRGILIGDTTFGKGSVQQVHELSDGAELRVTIARWYTPADNTIDGEGITPDIEVEVTESFDFLDENDVQLQRALEYLLSGE